MKLPEALPELEEPYIILEAPSQDRWLLIICSACFPLAGFAWMCNRYRSGNFELYHLPIALILLLMVSALFNRNLWQRWVSFAADRKGIYIPDFRLEIYAHIPWSNVGSSSVGLAGLRWRQKTVILEVKMSKEIIRPKSRSGPASFLQTLQDGEVMRFGLSHAGRNLEGTRQNIERIRRIALQNLQQQPFNPQTDK